MMLASEFWHSNNTGHFSVSMPLLERGNVAGQLDNQMTLPLYKAAITDNLRRCVTAPQSLQFGPQDVADEPCLTSH